MIVAVVGVLAPLTLAGRLASSADLDAFYAPFATFLHDRLAAGDLPFWAPGAFSGQPFLADAQSGVTYPPMLLASWLLGPIDALRAVATFHYLIAALGTYALARQLRASRTGSAFGAIAFAASGHLVARSAALGLLGGAAWLAPALALAEAAATARPSRRGFAIAGTRARARAPPRKRIAAARRAHAGHLRDLAGRARGRARGALRRRRARARVRPRGGGARCRGSSCCASPRHPATSTPMASARCSSATAAALVGRFGVSHSELATLYLGAATPALALIGLAPRPARRRPGAPARLADRVLDRVGRGPRRLADGSAAARAHGRRARARARHRARAALRVACSRRFALPEAKRWPNAAGVAALGLVARRPRSAARTASRSRYLIPLAGDLRRARAAPRLPARAALRCCSQLLRRRSRLAGDPPGSAAALAARRRRSRRSRPGARRSCSPGSAPRDRSGSPPPRPSRRSCTSSGAHRSRAARALLLDQEALRLGLEDVAGYNPVHLKRYDRLMLASNGGTRSIATSSSRCATRRRSCARWRCATTCRRRGVAAGPAGRLPRPAQRRHARRRRAAVRAHRAAGARAAGRARHLARARPHRDRSARAGRLVVADLVYPGWRVTIDGVGAAR